MARAKLDRIDRRILSDLQSNGRMTNVELAERAGISAPPGTTQISTRRNFARASASLTAWPERSVTEEPQSAGLVSEA